MAFQYDVEPADFLQLDLFPAKVTKDGTIFGEEYRVFVTNNYFYVFHDTVEGPEPFIKTPLTQFDGSARDGYTLETDDGTYSVIRAQNCGCGSRLRGIHPFAGIPYISQISTKVK